MNTRHKRSQSNQSSSSSLSLSTSFYQSLSIKLDIPVTSLSTSPLGHQVVLAAKRGLYIVDLNKPFDPPLTLHHLTKWEVVDVQWCPHKSHSHWIASTSNQKALIWNLDLLGRSNQVEFVLGKHTRAVSDMHWSPFHPHHLATCSYDAFIHIWDLRDGKHGKSAQSFSSWTLGANQVKFNRVNEYLLASAHDTDVRLWDTRKGSSPVSIITAHGMKVSGLDWSHHNERQLLTCSQDKTVKIWDILFTRTPKGIIQTGNAVYRARFTPFGNGIITMPQRKDNSLYLWSLNNLNTPAYVFSGHDDTPLEFVWRFQGDNSEAEDRREFQLVSWSKDHQLRLWPISVDIYKSLGHLNFSSQGGTGLNEGGMIDEEGELMQEVLSAASLDETSMRIRSEISRLIGQFTNVNVESVDVDKRSCILSVNYFQDSSKHEMNFRLAVDFPPMYSEGNPPQFDVLDNDVLPLAKRTVIAYKLQRLAQQVLLYDNSCLIPCIQHLFGQILPTIFSENFQYPSVSDGFKKTNALDSLEDPVAIGVDSDSDSSDFDVKRSDGYMIASIPTSDPKAQKENVSSGQGIKGSNTPFPVLCGVRFSISGQLVCFYSPIPHPSSTQFTTYTLTARNQKPILQSHAFSAQPKTFALFEGYISYLMSLQESAKKSKESWADLGRLMKENGTVEHLSRLNLPKESQLSSVSVGYGPIPSYVRQFLGPPESSTPEVDSSPTFSRLRRKSVASSSSSVDRDDRIYQLGIPYSMDLSSISLLGNDEDEAYRVQPLRDAAFVSDPNTPTATTVSTKLARRPRMSAAEPPVGLGSIPLQTFPTPSTDASLSLLPHSQERTESCPVKCEEKNESDRKFLMSFVRIWNFSVLTNQEINLLEKYRYDGNLREGCQVNADLALKAGKAEVAQIWKIIGQAVSGNTDMSFSIYWNALSTLESIGEHLTLAVVAVLTRHVWNSPTALWMNSNSNGIARESQFSHIQQATSQWSHYKISSQSGIQVNAFVCSLDGQISLLRPDNQQILAASINTDFVVRERLLGYIRLLSYNLFTQGRLQERLEILDDFQEVSELASAIQTGVCCSRCRNEMTIRKSMYTCNSCNHRSQAILTCGICRIPARNLIQVCLICNHGGHQQHMSSWFQVNDSCPSGCGCACQLYMNS